MITGPARVVRVVRRQNSPGHHAACQRGAVFATRTSALVRLPATARLVRVGRCYRDTRSAVGLGVESGERRPPRLNIAPRRQAAWWRGGGVGGRVAGAEHRSTEASSAVAAIPPLARSLGSPRRRPRWCLSAIAIPDSDNVHVVLRVWAFPAIHRLDLNRLRHRTRRTNACRHFRRSV
jgi:hypothetical protein